MFTRAWHCDVFLNDILSNFIQLQMYVHIYVKCQIMDNTYFNLFTIRENIYLYIYCFLYVIWSKNKIIIVEMNVSSCLGRCSLWISRVSGTPRNSSNCYSLPKCRPISASIQWVQAYLSEHTVSTGLSQWIYSEYRPISVNIQWVLLCNVHLKW